MKSPKISRRVFIRLMTLFGIGSGIALLERITQPIGAAQFVRWQARSKYQAYLSPKASVHILDCPSYQVDILRLLSEAWKKADMPDVAGKRVLVKPNLVDSMGGFPSVTDPQVILSVVDCLKELGAQQVVVGDGPAFRRDAQSVALAMGLAESLKKRAVRFVDLNYDDPQPLSPRGGWFDGIKEIWLPRHVVEADLIVSVPKMKVHHWAGISLSLKNLLGLLPGTRYGWPKNFLHFRGITISILGIYEMLPPVVSVVDGVIGMEGDGPLFGIPVSHGILVMGKDPVAVDVICARLMGYEPEEVEYLGMAAWSGIGQTNRIETHGLSIEQVRKNYLRPPSI